MSITMRKLASHATYLVHALALSPCHVVENIVAGTHFILITPVWSRTLHSIFALNYNYVHELYLNEAVPVSKINSVTPS